MKSCPYCGKEYPDEATICLIDREPLRDKNPQPSTSDEQAQEQLQAADKNAPYLTFPDYQWSARDAWKCIGMIIVFGIIFWITILGLSWHFSAFRIWRLSGFGNFSTTILSYAIELLVAAYFARTEIFAAFWKGFGLDQKPSNYVWFGVTVALIIRVCGHFILTHGWSRGVLNYDLYGFRHAVGFERYFFLLPPLILAPFFEESAYRGFLYQAFRRSYSLNICIFLIVTWTAFTHWPYYSHSWMAALSLSALTLVQCHLREKSNSLWDCILCHFAYNASVLSVSAIK
jgi:membrane protease YdiL (CAAX protease family)